MIPLNKAAVDRWYVLDHIEEHNPQIRNKMLTMGFVAGRPVKINLTTGLISTKYVVQIDHSRYALTEQEAEHIYVRTIE